MREMYTQALEEDFSREFENASGIYEAYILNRMSSQKEEVTVYLETLGRTSHEVIVILWNKERGPASWEDLSRKIESAAEIIKEEWLVKFAEYDRVTPTDVCKADVSTEGAAGHWTNLEDNLSSGLNQCWCLVPVKCADCGENSEDSPRWPLIVDWEQGDFKWICENCIGKLPEPEVKSNGKHPSF
jgi:hypothetical protein